MSTSTDVARRNGTDPAVTQAALAIKPGQTTWDKYQEAALSQIGLKDASNADRAVFLHQCQRTGLDPFSRQIYMINRREKKNEKVNGQWVERWTDKWTIQTGIEGWRVIRDRAERREGLRGILSRFSYYDHDDNERKVWTRAEPPAAVEVTYTVVESSGREIPYTSVLRFTEYLQLKNDIPVAQWATKPVHMLEKCTEADVYRRAFPQDFSGIELSDAMPPEDPDAPPVQAERSRVTADQIRQRRQTVTSEVITPDPSPAQSATPPAAPAGPVPDAGEAPAGGEPAPRLASGGQVGAIQGHFERFGYGTSPDDKAARLRITARLAGYDGELASTKQLDPNQAASVIRQIAPLPDAAALDALLDDGEAPEGDTQ